MGAFKDHVVIVVAGASGDLAKKKTFPALFSLFRHGLLPQSVRIVGYARTKMDEAEYHRRLASYFKLEDAGVEQKAAEFKALCTYVSGQYDVPDGFIKLREHIEELEAEPVRQGYKRNRLFYLALPPSVFGPVCTGIRQNVYPGADGEARLIVEKPFGHDLDSFRELQGSIAPQWPEEEVYRIDHYLGKEMVKNVINLRFFNRLFESVWNRDNIALVKIQFKEPFGTEGRGGYFDEFGIIRDVMQNHLLQVLSLVAMEPPKTFGPEDIRDEKVRLLRAIKPINLDDVVVGQYDRSLDGTKPAYTDDETVPAGSRCSTYAAISIDIDNERWAGVPFIMTAGKALDEALVDVRIQFKESAGFGDYPSSRDELVLRVQPKEAIYMKLVTKYPGYGSKVAVSDLELPYSKRFPGIRIPEAYEALILDALNEDHSNFVRDDELDVSWRIFTPLLQHVESADTKLEKYPYGSQGPAGASGLLTKKGYISDEKNPYFPVANL
ncbi:glucose-6-phosphate 1-dehydrogenase [Trichomonascus vanleenenianus]|uniref:glucose-6-phosphate dehydrogenase n=1 Tax=Trichomonascus vanleenenianus TaxID=2268995 RepID=UPI003EC976BD